MYLERVAQIVGARSSNGGVALQGSPYSSPDVGREVLARLIDGLVLGVEPRRVIGGGGMSGLMKACATKTMQWL